MYSIDRRSLRRHAEEMVILSQLLGRQRKVLKQRAKLSRAILLAAIAVGVFGFTVFLITFLDSYPFETGKGIFANNPERILGAANFGMMTSIGAALRLWRTRRTRIQMLIAEALIRENDGDTAMRLLLEPVFGEDVWYDSDTAMAGHVNS